jgi:hypothetical protein
MIRKNAFGRWMPIPLVDICLGAAVAVAFAADVAVAETLDEDDDYYYGNVVDFDSVAVVSDDLRGVSLIFEESAADSGNFSVAAFAHVDVHNAVVHDAVAVADVDAHTRHYYSGYYRCHRYCYWHGTPLDWAAGQDTRNHLDAASGVDVPPYPPNRNRLAGQRRAAVAAFDLIECDLILRLVTPVQSVLVDTVATV